jgi:hypothetical protein
MFDILDSGYFLRKVFGVLVGKDRGMRPIGILRCRFKGDIKIDRKEIGRRDVDVFDLSVNRYK